MCAHRPAADLFAGWFRYAVGYHFIERATGSMNGNFLGIGMDLATNASVLVDQSQPMGVLITNGEFTAFCDADLTFCPSETADPHHVVVTANNNGAVKFVNSAFWGPAPQIAQVDGKGTVTFSQCHFDAWDRHLKNGECLTQVFLVVTVSTSTLLFMHMHGGLVGLFEIELVGTYVTHGTPAISQLGGTLIVALSDFSQPGDSQTHLSIQGGVKTIFTNNVINGPMGIDGNATKQHIVTGNADG